MVGLRVVELAGRGDLGRDRAVAGLTQALLVGACGRLRGVALLLGVVVEGGAVLRADVVPLSHPLRRVVALPEDAQHLLIGGQARIEDDQHRLGVPREPRADLLVARVRRDAAGVAHRRGMDARRLPEEALRPPEAAHADQRALAPLREGRRELPPGDEVRLGHRHPLGAAGERLAGGRYRRPVPGEHSEHRAPSSPSLPAYPSPTDPAQRGGPGRPGAQAMRPRRRTARA